MKSLKQGLDAAAMIQGTRGADHRCVFRQAQPAPAFQSIQGPENSLVYAIFNNCGWFCPRINGDNMFGKPFTEAGYAMGILHGSTKQRQNERQFAGSERLK